MPRPIKSRPTDRRLLERTRAGDADAFGDFFARHGETVLAFLRRRSGDAELAADLTAETFAAALVAVHRGNGDAVDNGAAWLMGIAKHKLVDSVRAGRAEAVARELIGVPAPALDDDAIACIDELAVDGRGLRLALAALPRDERAAVIERVLLDRDYEEIARGAQQSAVVIRKRVSRGLGRLRHAMGVKP